MKIKKLFTLVPALAVLTLVGSGFSAWVFNEAKTETFNFNGSLNVVTASNLSLTTPKAPEFNVTFDQGGFKNAEVLTEGITVVWVTEENAEAQYTFTLIATDMPLVGGQNSRNIKVDCSFEVTGSGISSRDNSITLNANDYVEPCIAPIEFNLSSAISDSGDYYSYISDIEPNSDGTIGTVTYSITIDLSTIEGKVLQYKEGKKPVVDNNNVPEDGTTPIQKAINDWTDLQDAVQNIGLNLNISASLS